MDAISHASLILAWHEHLPSEDLPPKWMWGLPEELEQHFERLKDQRADGRSKRDDDDGGLSVRNEYARNRGANLR